MDNFIYKTLRALAIFFLASISTNSFAFTLLSSNPPRFSSPEITVRPSTADCSNIELSAAELEDFIEVSVNKYWNTVPTTSLRFVIGEPIDPGTDSLTRTQALALTPNNQILVSCSDDPALFSSNQILAIGTMDSSLTAKGIVLINNLPGAVFSTLNEENKQATFAHELGHAIGIGHSQHPHALMYYAVSSELRRAKLAQDDADAATFLYPNHDQMLLLNACGSLVHSKQKPIFGLLFLVFFTYTLLLLITKASPSVYWRRLRKNSSSIF